MHLPSRILAPFLALAAAVPVLANEYVDAASDMGDALVRMARKEGKARWWPQYEGGPPGKTEAKRNFPVSFYSGLPGTGFFLLNLHRVTGEKKYLAAAEGAGWRLVETGKALPGGGLKWEGTTERKGRSIPDGTRHGLYVGNGGIGLFLMHLHLETKEAAFRTAAIGAFRRILDEATGEKEGFHWTYSFMDIIGGEAGIGLALLEMHRLTEDDRYLEVARKAATWLVASADRKGDAWRWAKYGFHDPNFSHGTAGVAFFLAAMGEKAWTGPALSAARWVEAQGVTCGKDGIEWRYYAEPPPEGKRNWVMNSWCHGAPGTARFFLLLHRLTGEARWLKTAARGGEGIRHALRMASGKIFYYNPSYCCGAAGCLDAFTELHRASGEAKWLRDAKIVADDVIAKLEGEGRPRLHAEYDREDQAAKKHPYYATSFMSGNAGIGYALLHLGAVMEKKEGKLIHFPDQPFAHDKK